VDGKRHGEGELVFSRKSEEFTKMKGTFKDGELRGDGEIWYTDGNNFKGKVTKTKGGVSGSGMMTYENGNVYTGRLVDGKRHGEGELVFSRKSEEFTKMKGAFKDGELCGDGEVWCKDGDNFKGKVSKTKGGISGSGVKKDNNGDVYTGPLVDGRLHGEGEYLCKHGGCSGDRYTGSFHENRMHGQGEYVWASGNVYTGSWVKHERTGKGKFVYVAHSKWKSYDGDWKSDNKVGKGILTFLDGHEEEVGFDANERIVRRRRLNAAVVGG
jgi:hypothetical protein